MIWKWMVRWEIQDGDGLRCRSWWVVRVVSHWWRCDDDGSGVSGEGSTKDQERQLTRLTTPFNGPPSAPLILPSSTRHHPTNIIQVVVLQRLQTTSRKEGDQTRVTWAQRSDPWKHMYSEKSRKDYIEVMSDYRLEKFSSFFASTHLVSSGCPVTGVCCSDWSLWSRHLHSIQSPHLVWRGCSHCWSPG